MGRRDLIWFDWFRSIVNQSRHWIWVSFETRLAQFWNLFPAVKLVALLFRVSSKTFIYWSFSYPNHKIILMDDFSCTFTLQHASQLDSTLLPCIIIRSHLINILTSFFVNILKLVLPFEFMIEITKKYDY